MKLIKKLLWLGASLCLTLGFSAAAISCENPQGDTSESGSELLEGENNDNAEYVYRVSLQNETGFGFSGATVKLMDGDVEVAVKKTNASGNANFLAEDIKAPGEYTIVVEGAPDGYVLPDDDLTTSKNAGTQTIVPIKPTGLLSEDAPEGTVYKLGSVMHDFNVTLSNGANYRLSTVLEAKQLVMLNFWASWCGFCKAEFNPMHDAMVTYNDRVSVLALTVEGADTNSYVSSYKQEESFEYFNMGRADHHLFENTSDNPYAYAKTFPEYDETGALSTAIPHTVLIDRYGVVVYNHVGALSSASDFTTLFDRFVGDDYVPTVIGSTSEGSGETGGEGDNRIEPNVEAPAIDDLSSALTESSASQFSFRYQEKNAEGDPFSPDEQGYDKYNWPWLIGEDDEGEYIYASNKNVNNSYAILYSTITVAEGDTIAFDYKVGSESTDRFYVMLDGQIVKQYSGYHSREWQTSYAYVFEGHEAGTHEIAFVFLKDGDTMNYDDVVQLKNLRVVDESDLADVQSEISIFRQAANQKDPDKNATKQYLHYVDFVEPGAANLGKSGDGYYHVRNADGTVGPVLYANMLAASQWNEYPLWTLAYSNYIVGDGMNFYGPMQEFAWEANQPTDAYGYTPVTQDLYYLLNKAAEYTTFGEKFSGDYHDKEWLELCVYWQRYGKAPAPKDPMECVTFEAAKEMLAGTNGNRPNTVNVPFKMNPRGFKYKFTPKTSGVYHVYSEGDKNPNVFLFAPDRKTQLGFWQNKPVVTDPKDNDFEFYWYFEAGTTYYILCTTYLDEVATYDVFIDYIASSYTYRTNAATEVYSINLNTYELFLPDAIDYEYSDPDEGGDGFYHHVKKDGSLGSVIYLDVMNPTPFSSSLSLYEVCDRDIREGNQAKRTLYIKGVDYTQRFYDICLAASRGDGYAKVNAELFKLLQILTIDGAEGIEETWLQLCYYDKTLSATENDNI